jgi:arginyl-tRNA synthetase
MNDKFTIHGEIEAELRRRGITHPLHRPLGAPEDDYWDDYWALYKERLPDEYEAVRTRWEAKRAKEAREAELDRQGRGTWGGMYRFRDIARHLRRFRQPGARNVEVVANDLNTIVGQMRKGYQPTGLDRERLDKVVAEARMTGEYLVKQADQIEQILTTDIVDGSTVELKIIDQTKEKTE